MLSFPAPLPGIPRDVEGSALREQGFRHVERQRLFLDPRECPRARFDRPGFSLRPMVARDREAVLRLDLRAYHHHIDEAFGPGASVSHYGPGYLQGIFTKGDPGVDLAASLIAQGPRGPVGEVLVLVLATACPQIQDLAVDPRYQGRGIGSWLLRSSLGRLAKRGVRRVTIGVTVGNPRGAYGMYRHLGFRRALTPAGRMPGLWIHEATRRRLRLAMLGD